MASAAGSAVTAAGARPPAVLLILDELYDYRNNGNQNHAEYY